MAYNRLQAARLLSASELPLFLDSLPDRIGAHRTARLRTLVKRTRAQRDKARDLWQRQRVATRRRTGSKGGRSGDANARTDRKARVLDEALQRLERQLARLEAPAAAKPTRMVSLQAAVKAAAKPAPGAGSANARRPAPGSAKAPAQPPQRGTPGIGATSEQARSARHALQFKMAGAQRVQGHVGVAGRRDQARLDGKR